MKTGKYRDGDENKCGERRPDYVFDDLKDVAKTIIDLQNISIILLKFDLEAVT